MAQYFEIHPENPQPRLLKQAVSLLQGIGAKAVIFGAWHQRGYNQC